MVSAPRSQGWEGSPPPSRFGFRDLVETIGFSFAWKSNVIMAKLLGSRQSASLTEKHASTFDLKKCLAHNDLLDFVPPRLRSNQTWHQAHFI